MILEAVRADLGIALMPTIFCAEEVRAGRLRVVLPRATPPIASVWVVYPSRRHLSPAVRACRPTRSRRPRFQAGRSHTAAQSGT